MTTSFSDQEIRFLKPALRPEIAALREAALHKKDWGWSPVLPQIDAESWQEHNPDEDWLRWRGRWVANRLRKMPIELSAGERIVGRPVLRSSTPEEQEANERAQGLIPFTRVVIISITALLDKIPLVKTSV